MTRYQTDQLTIESHKNRDKLVIRWLGRSEARDPGRALQPVLDAVGADVSGAINVEFDFRMLEYMNSSTIHPILKLVQSASQSSSSVRVVYDRNKNWQRLSFMAMGAVLAGLKNVEVSA
jgi:hypothetical protein